MTLRAFMFAADALRLEEGVGFQVATPQGVRPVEAPAEVKNRNAQSMAMLQGMLAGTKKAPGKRRR